MRCERWRGAAGGWWVVVVCANFSTFRLSDLSICWEVGKLAGCGGFLVYRRGKRASAQEEGLLGGRGSGAAGSGTFGRVTADAPLLPAAGWCARWVWSTRGGVREKRRQPARSGGAGASVRVGRKGCWVQGAGKRGGVMNRNDTVAGEYRAVVVYPAGKRT